MEAVQETPKKRAFGNSMEQNQLIANTVPKNINISTKYFTGCGYSPQSIVTTLAFKMEAVQETPKKRAFGNSMEQNQLIANTVPKNINISTTLLGAAIHPDSSGLDMMHVCPRNVFRSKFFLVSFLRRSLCMGLALGGGIVSMLISCTVNKQLVYAGSGSTRVVEQLSSSG